MKDLHDLFRQSLAGLRVLVVATLLLGLAYPLAVTGFAAVAAPWRSEGSLVTADGSRTTDPDQAVGSELLGQSVTDETLFQPRPSAAGDGYDPLSSYGSNLGPESPELLAAITERQAVVAEREGVEVADVPPDAVTASGSGLDPDISVAYAELQAPRVAAANDLPEDEVDALVVAHTEGRTLGVLGEPRVNVLLLNVAVREAAGRG
ncbi:potassium-transporting ATPase subunit KdpC [Nocardioides alkalitolerans]|uniref:potassium-transporting ATPase subunit KdpC n=1 Tax=Nocardioides alkalitolerans TaxID=281714 RepID=UPI000411D236|nr:potassium-transporting ATPase subunit KdpC [Nocardioides alkalitolerans]